MITIDYKDRKPIYLQIIEKIEYLALNGILEPDQQLPSVRSLAMDLSINPNTIQRAYRELEQKGVIYSVSGRGSFISASKENLLKEKLKDFIKKLEQIISEANSLAIDETAFYDYCRKIYDKLREDNKK